MTDSRTLFLLLSGFFLGLVLVSPTPLIGQYIDIRIEVETESTVKTEKEINFGSFNVNAGRMNIMLGDVNMGVFSVNAIENQELLVSFNTSSYLDHTNSAITDRIPFDIEIEYGYERNDFRDTKPLSESLQTIYIRENPDVGPWNNLYIFIFGSVEIGNIAPGIYRTDVTLNLQYL